VYRAYENHIVNVYKTIQSSCGGSGETASLVATTILKRLRPLINAAFNCQLTGQRSLFYNASIQQLTVAYLECAKGGPSGSPGRPRAKPRYGAWGTKLKLFVNECLNFDVLEEKISKTAKIPSSKIRVC